MTNFGNVIYEGCDQNKANAAAEKTGFECTVIHTKDCISYTWSPISGWRNLYKFNTEK